MNLIKNIFAIEPGQQHFTISMINILQRAWSATFAMSLIDILQCALSATSSTLQNATDSLQVTHNASPVTPINFGGTVLKESVDLDILGVTFDSKMTFEKHNR